MSKTINAVNIRRDFYTMATTDGDNAEIVMYGDIVEQQPTDWWGDPIDGQYIIEQEFLEDLQKVSDCKNITIRMNSCGGDAGVSILIHNRLRELSANGTNITCIVDGVAMSGGSLIMCAADTVKVNPSSLVMIHKCWSFLFGGYNADELRSLAASNDAYDKSQISIYKRKCKLSDTVINHMMSDTTYMTGREAVKKGFADELLEDAEPIDIAASSDRHSLFVRGRKMHLTPGMSVPDNIPMVKTAENAETTNTSNKPVTPAGRKGGISMPKTVEELRDEYPEQVRQIEESATNSVDSDAAVSAAVSAERERIRAIDEVAGLFDDSLVNAAKYGDDACTAQELAYRAAQQAAKDGKSFISGMKKDAEASNTDKVGAAPGEDPEQEAEKTAEQRMSEAREQVSALLGKRKED